MDQAVTQQQLIVTGQVQGVGFRPWVYRLASELGLRGQVANLGSAAVIDLVGSESQLDLFQKRLWQEQPAAVEIAAIQCRALHTAQPFDAFQISESTSVEQPLSGELPADLAICNDCLSELFAPDNRRYLYPFINCTQCGPRYSLISALPYDRARTSMVEFPLCDSCRQEYQTPDARRFHAQSNACWQCGPQLSLVTATGQPISAEDPLTVVVQRLQQGQIVALKGLSGIHLVCDATNAAAVERLRQRKRRPAKPLAIMALNSRSIESLTAEEDAASWLERAERPVVLLPKSSDCDVQLPGIAPGVADLGLMLPYTPLHYLLFYRALGAPAGSDWLDQWHPLKLVMTSANLSGEPLIADNQQALHKLAGVADCFLLHDRPVVQAIDDSVVQAGQPGMLVRRARGLAPLSIQLPAEGPSVLALGAYLKDALCLTWKDRAYLSPYLGDLDHPETCERLHSSVRQMVSLLNIRPQRLACDRHPDFFSSRLAEQLSEELEVPLIRVQHHQAHLAAVIAEHRLSGPLLGIALDGVGLGEDGRAWGGELFTINAQRPLEFSRIGHLEELPLVGGDLAVTQIWRLAAALLLQAGHKSEADRRYAGQPGYQSLVAYLQSGAMGGRCGPATTSSAGRWFDAAASLTGLCQRVDYEAQAAMQLEAAAMRASPIEVRGLVQIVDNRLMLTPLLLALLQETDSAAAAACFHAELADGIARWVISASQQHQTQTLVASGGCFTNRILRETLVRRLHTEDIKLYLPQKLPCNDGAIALGQAWMAICNGQK